MQSCHIAYGGQHDPATGGYNESGTTTPPDISLFPDPEDGLTHCQPLHGALSLPPASAHVLICPCCTCSPVPLCPVYCLAAPATCTTWYLTCACMPFWKCSVPLGPACGLSTLLAAPVPMALSCPTCLSAVYCTFLLPVDLLGASCTCHLVATVLVIVLLILSCSCCKNRHAVRKPKDDVAPASAPPAIAVLPVFVCAGRTSCHVCMPPSTPSPSLARHCLWQDRGSNPRGVHMSFCMSLHVYHLPARCSASM